MAHICMHVLSNPHTVPCTIVPPSLSVHESLWQKFHEYCDLLHPSDTTKNCGEQTVTLCRSSAVLAMMVLKKLLEAITDSRLFWDRTKVTVTGQRFTKAAAICWRSVLVKHNLAAFCCPEEGTLIIKKCQNLLKSIRKVRSWCSCE